MKSLKGIAMIMAVVYFGQNTYAQNGPGGLGNTDGSSALELWLRADQGVSTIDGKIQTWSDLSGNGRDLTQSNANNRPSFNSANTELNEQPTIDFVSSSSTYLTGPTTQDFFGNAADQPTSAADIFVVFKQPLTNSAYILQFPRISGSSSFFSLVSNAGNDTPADNGELNDIQAFIRQDAPAWSVLSSEGSKTDNFTVDNFHLARLGFNPTTEHFWLFDNNEEIQSYTIANQITYDNGDGDEVFRMGSNTTTQHYDGEIAEMFIFSTEIDSAQYIILQNYFNARYGLVTPNDFYVGDLDANYNHIEGVFGIGRYSGTELINSANNEGIQLEATAGLDDGDYLFAGHRYSNNAIIDNDINGITGTEPARMKRIWFLDQTDASTALTIDVTFDLDDAHLQDASLASATNYKLIRRSTANSGAWTIESITPTFDDVENTITFANVSVTDEDYYTIATTDNTASPLGDIQQTWYSFQSGSWGDPNTWTLDGATTPLFDNENNETPGSGDIVVVTAGRTVNMYESDNSTILNNITIQDLTLRTSGRLNILTSVGHDLGDISGAGTMAIQGYANTGTTAYIENLPAGDYSEFADQLLGGTITINTATNDVPLVLNQDLTVGITTDANGAISRNLTINMGDSDDKVILQRDLHLARNLNLTRGQLQIHRNSAETYTDITFTDSDLTIEVVNNVTISANASLITGTANQRHQFNSYGNFTINGTAAFTQRVAANLTADATNGIIDLNFLSTTADQTLACNAQANFYRIKVDKESSAYTLSITASADGNFNLYGRADYSIDSDLGYGGTNNNAFALVTGTAKIGSNVNFTLNEGGNYSISSNGQLWIAGGEILKTSGFALVPYGTFKISSGIAELLVQSGITIRDAGVVEVTGGSVYANQIRTSIQASDDIGSYIQSGGSVYVNGGSGIGPSGTFGGGTQEDYFVFCLPEEENVFRMSGGTLEIQRSNYNTTSSTGTPNDEDATDDLGGGIFINSDPQNIEVTGGTVIMNMDNTVPFKISSRAPFFDVVMTNSGGAAISDGDGQTTVNIQTTDDNIVFLAGGQSGDGSAADKIMTAQPLVVLNDLTIGDGTNPVRFDHLGQDVTIGRNFTIEANAQYYFGDEDLLPTDGVTDNGLNSNTTVVPSSHQNTTIFNGTLNGTISMSNLDVVTNTGTTSKNDTENNEQVFFNITIQKENDAILTLAAPNKPIAGGVSNVSNTLRTGNDSFFRLESGTLDQSEHSIRFYGNVYNASQLGVYEEGVTDLGALLKFRPVTFTIETEPGAVFGNFRLNCQDQIISIDNDVTIERLEYLHGRLYIGEHNLLLEELDVNLTASNADYNNCNGCYSVEDMIITDGNASDGGLTLRVSAASNPTANGRTNFQGNTTIENIDEADFLFPVGIGTSGLHDGTSKYTPALLSISNVGDVGSDGEAFITINPVDATLQTTVITEESLSYYWRIRTEGFDTDPTIDLLTLFGNDTDDPSSGANLTSYVAGKVDDGGTYTRLAEANTVSATPSPDFETTDFSFDFDGGSTFTLTDANFTAGDANAFVGAADVYYSRNTGGWNNNNRWTFNDTGNDPIAGSQPGAGDVVVIRNGNEIRVDNYLAQAAEVIIDGSNGRSKLVFRDPNGNGYNSVFGKVSATASGVSPSYGTLEFYIDGSWGGNFPAADYGEFVNYVNSDGEYTEWTYNYSHNAAVTTGVVVLPNTVDTYPQLRFQIEGDDNANSATAAGAKVFQFGDVDVTVNDRMRFQDGIIVRLSDATDGSLTVNADLEFDNDGENSRLQFPGNTTNARSLTVNGNIVFNGSAEKVIEVYPTGSTVEHRLIANSDIDFQGGGFLDLNSGTAANITLEFGGDGNNQMYASTGSPDQTPNLYRMVMNKGTDQTSSFELNTAIDVPTPAALGDQSIEIVNGLLIFNEATIDVVLTDASTGDFNLPNLSNGDASSGSAGLEIRQGIARIEGDDTGLILDGSLILSGGTLDMSSGAGNGNNFIEYSATGYAIIEVNDAASTLSVGSQIRRSFYAESGILDLTITDGTVEIGASANGDYRRGMLEVVNTGSNLVHTGGTLRFLNQNGASATDALKASLLLEPATYDLTGSTIEIDLNEADDDNFSINSAIALNNLSILSTSGVDSEVATIKTRNLTINGDLTLSNDIEFRSNNLDLTIKGNFTINDNATYSAGINETIFDIATGETSIFGGTNLDAVEFYDFDKTGEGSLSLSKSIEITGSTFKISEGTLADNDNLIDFLGQSMTNDGTHTSGSNQVNAGIRFKRTSGEQVLSTSAEGVFGNLTINNNDGVALPDANQEFQINNNLTLEAGILDIGPALLLFTSTGTITNGDGNGSELSHFGEENQIQTNSSIIDFGMEKEFASSETSDFVFPVGEGNRYTPVKVDFSSGNSGSTVGRLRIRPRNAVAPIMLSEDQATQDAILQYHWLVNGTGFTDFDADLIASYDDDVIGTDAESTYRGARAIFSDPNLAVENPFPSSGDFVDDVNNTITFPIASESDFSGEYFAGDPASIPDSFETLIFDGVDNNDYDHANNYFFDADDSGDFSIGDTREANLNNVIGGAIEIAASTTMSLNINNVSFSRLIIPSDGTLEIDGTNGHILGQVSGSGTIRINSDGTTASLPAGDYLNFFDCSGGALEYGGDGNYTIMVESNEVRQLTLSGTGIKSFVSNSNINVCENLIINDGTLNLADERQLTVGSNMTLNDGAFNMATDGVIRIEGNTNLFGGTFTGADNSDVELLGDLTRTTTTIVPSGGSPGQVSFLGSTTQNVTGNITLENVVINNTAASPAINLTGGTELEISNNIQLLDGVIATDNTQFQSGSFTISNVLIFGTSASYTGGSSNSFIDGVARKTSLPANSTFTFPIGDGAIYAPLIVEEDNIGNVDWTARYQSANPTTTLSNNYDNIGSTTVSTHEFWVVYPSVGSQTANIGLTYGTQSSVITPTETTVVQIEDNVGGGDGVDDLDTWEDAGREGLSSGASASSGVITANTSTITLSFFTLGGQTASALPVELISFTAELADSEVILHWSTASELNNEYFEIERSVDGIDFEIIGDLDGHGTTNEITNYSFADDQPYYGISYYRLAQVDYDGTRTVFDAISINNDSFKKGIEASIFPNPANSYNVNLRLSSGDENSAVQVMLHDVSGNFVYLEEIEPQLGLSEYKLNVPAGLDPGIYLMTIQQANNKEIQRLIIK